MYTCMYVHINMYIHVCNNSNPPMQIIGNTIKITKIMHDVMYELLLGNGRPNSLLFRQVRIYVCSQIISDV